jgi:hypothetical protein
MVVTITVLETQPNKVERTRATSRQIGLITKEIGKVSAGGQPSAEISRSFAFAGDLKAGLGRFFPDRPGDPAELARLGNQLP